MYDSLDLTVFTTLQRWLAAGETSWLCTVTATWGSAPRQVGSLMVCNGLGEQSGSLSGGCIEEDLLAKLVAGEIADDRPQHIIYGADPAEAERLKLPCGGTLGVLVEPLLATAENLAWVAQVVEQLQARQCISRQVDWRSGGQTLQTGSHGPRFQLSREDTRPLALQQIYGPQYHLFLIGISEVTRALASFAVHMDYRVTVCDPRPEQIVSWDIDAVSLVRAMPDDALLEQADDPRSAILALTHDPRIDDMGLLEAFNTRAFYIGAMGSMATSLKRRERLASLGVSDHQLARLHAPIGLDIGSKTPAEIAIAILAELTQVRAAAPVSLGSGEA